MQVGPDAGREPEFPAKDFSDFHTAAIVLNPIFRFSTEEAAAGSLKAASGGPTVPHSAEDGGLDPRGDKFAKFAEKPLRTFRSPSRGVANSSSSDCGEFPSFVLGSDPLNRVRGVLGGVELIDGALAVFLPSSVLTSRDEFIAPGSPDVLDAPRHAVDHTKVVAEGVSEAM